MTLEEMYQEIEGNYSDILDRLRKHSGDMSRTF